MTITVVGETCNLSCPNGGVCHFGQANFGRVTSFPYSVTPDFLMQYDQNGMYCQCPDGWAGPQCDHRYDICDQSYEGGNFPCFHGSKCINLGKKKQKQWACDCTKASWLFEDKLFAGTHCQYHNANKCAPSGEDGLEESRWFCVNEGDCVDDET